MPKPTGTYLMEHGRTKTRFEAELSKRVSVFARPSDPDRLQRAVDQKTEGELDQWRRDMAELIHAVSTNGGVVKEDKIRSRVSKILENVSDILEKSQSTSIELHRMLGEPVELVMRGAQRPAAGGGSLALLIAMLHVLQVFVRIRSRPRPSPR